MSDARALAAMLQALDQLATERDEWWPLNESIELERVTTGAPCARYVVAPKGRWLGSVLRDQPGLGSVTLVARPTLVPSRHAQTIRQEAQRAGVPISFVGDLDPYDLTTFATLKFGGLAADGSLGDEIEVEYLGVSDPWLALCDTAWKPSWRRTNGAPATAMPLTPFELENLRRLESLGLPWDAIVGPRAMSLLRSGRKVELEGASNPAFFDDAFPDRLARFVSGSAGAE